MPDINQQASMLNNLWGFLGEYYGRQIFNDTPENQQRALSALALVAPSARNMEQYRQIYNPQVLQAFDLANLMSQTSAGRDTRGEWESIQNNINKFYDAVKDTNFGGALRNFISAYTTEKEENAQSFQSIGTPQQAQGYGTGYRVVNGQMERRDANGNYVATGEALPANYQQQGGQMRIAGQEGAQGGQNNEASVNQLYQKYFGRNAEQNELEYWTTRPTAELETALAQGYQQTSGHVYDGTPITPGNTQSNNDLGITTGIDYLDELPPEILNSPIWQGLSDEEKALFTNQWHFSQETASDAERQEQLDAIEAAKGLINPYYDELLTILQTTITDNFENTEAGYALKSQIIQNNINRINKDLTTGVERLTIDQQAEYTKLKTGYENQLTDTQNQMSQSGNVFSSRAGDLLARAAQEQRTTQTSTSRGFEQRIEDIQTASDRALADQALNQQEAQRLRIESLTGWARQAESQMGTQSYTELMNSLNSELQGVLSGIGTIGNIAGSNAFERNQAILSTATNILGSNNLDLSQFLT